MQLCWGQHAQLGAVYCCGTLLHDATPNCCYHPPGPALPGFLPKYGSTTGTSMIKRSTRI